jgi:hypothetical protein
VLAEAALLFGKPLFFLALRAAPVHLPLVDIIFEKKPATRTFRRSGLDIGLAPGHWTLDNRFTVFAPVLSFKRLAALRTFFDCHFQLRFIDNGCRYELSMSIS